MKKCLKGKTVERVKIQYKGKTLDSPGGDMPGEWVYGELEYICLPNGAVVSIRIRNRVRQKAGGSIIFSSAINPKTLQKYMGKDKNGKKVFVPVNWKKEIRGLIIGWE